MQILKSVSLASGISINWEHISGKPMIGFKFNGVSSTKVPILSHHVQLHVLDTMLSMDRKQLSEVLSLYSHIVNTRKETEVLKNLEAYTEEVDLYAH